MPDEVLCIPANLTEQVDRFFALPATDQERYQRSAYWLEHAMRVFPQSRSDSYVSLIAAVEALMDEERGAPHCEACGKSLGKGPTARFRDFLEAHAPDQAGGTAKGRNNVYGARSALTHGWRLLASDLMLSGGMDPREAQDYDLFKSAWGAVGVALVHWLESSGGATATVGVPPVESIELDQPAVGETLEVKGMHQSSRPMRAVGWSVLLVLAVGTAFGLVAPFAFWPNAVRSIVDQTIHGYLLRPSMWPLVVLLLLAAAFWIGAMGWLIDEHATHHPLNEQGSHDRRAWRPRKSWAASALVLGVTAAWLLLITPDSPGPGARDTGRSVNVCNDDGGECLDAPVLEAYRWGKPFLLRAERENIQWATAALVLWFPVAFVAIWLGERLSPVKSRQEPEYPLLTVDNPAEG